MSDTTPPTNTPTDPQPTDPSPKKSSEPPSMPDLESFIFKPDPYRNEVVPRRLDPEKVADFLKAKIDKKTKLQSVLQAEKVVVFYDIHEIVGNFKQFLDRSESNPEDVRRAISFTRAIARVGQPEDLEFAKKYYQHLVQRGNSQQEFEDLVLLYESLGISGDANILRQKIAAKIQPLEAKSESDYQARIEFRKLQQIGNAELTRAEEANKIKAKILNITDRNQRINEEIKAYLAIQYGYVQYLHLWAAGRLRRETWAAQPAQQIVRPEKPSLSEDVARAFRSFLDKLGQIPNLQSEQKEALRLRILRAIRFFGGTVTEKSDIELLEVYRNEQIDILANEGFLIEPPA